MNDTGTPERRSGGGVADAADKSKNAGWAFWCPVCGVLEFPLTLEEAEELKKEHEKCWEKLTAEVRC